MLRKYKSGSTNHKANYVECSCKEERDKMTAQENQHEPTNKFIHCTTFRLKVHDIICESTYPRTETIQIFNSYTASVSTSSGYYSISSETWLHLPFPVYMIKYRENKQCTETEQWSSNNPLISPSKSNFNSILCLCGCSSLTEFDGNLQ